MRLEYKYLVDNNRHDELIAAVKPYLVPDTNYSPSNHYTVRSIYFDTSKLKYYHEKLEGINVRKKLRVRGYNEFNSENVVFLEIKRKYENYIDKDRSALMYYDLDELLKTRNIESYVLTENGYANSREDAEKFLHHVFKKSLKPIVLVVYDREAYYSKFDSNLRITLDKNLRYLMQPSLNKLYTERDMKYALRNKFIFEVKFNKGFPKWLKNMISEFQLSRKALSKYTICLDKENMFDTLTRKRALYKTGSVYSHLFDYQDETD